MGTSELGRRAKLYRLTDAGREVRSRVSRRQRDLDAGGSARLEVPDAGSAPAVLQRGRGRGAGGSRRARRRVDERRAARRLALRRLSLRVRDRRRSARRRWRAPERTVPDCEPLILFHDRVADRGGPGVRRARSTGRRPGVHRQRSVRPQVWQPLADRPAHCDQAARRAGGRQASHPRDRRRRAASEAAPGRAHGVRPDLRAPGPGRIRRHHPHGPSRQPAAPKRSRQPCARRSRASTGSVWSASGTSCRWKTWPVRRPAASVSAR